MNNIEVKKMKAEDVPSQVTNIEQEEADLICPICGERMFSGDWTNFCPGCRLVYRIVKRWDNRR